MSRRMRPLLEAAKNLLRYSSGAFDSVRVFTQPACTELAQAVEGGHQLAAAARQGVKHLRARRRPGFASENAGLLEIAEPLGQHLLGNSRHRAFEGAKVKRPMVRNPFHDAGRPTAFHQMQGESCGTGAAFPSALRQNARYGLDAHEGASRMGTGMSFSRR